MRWQLATDTMPQGAGDLPLEDSCTIGLFGGTWRAFVFLDPTSSIQIGTIVKLSFLAN
jgi:hypothetical protein